MMILLGKKYEEIYEKTKELPDIKVATSDDERELLGVLRDTIPNDP